MNIGDSSRPEDGDLVLEETRREGQPVYLLRTVPGLAQILIRSREDAVARAVTVGRRRRVRVWVYSDDQFALVDDFRFIGSN